MELSVSYRYPVSMVVQNDGISIKCPFKFELMWLREEGFFDKVLNWWASALPIEVNVAFQFFSKFGHLKAMLKEWNKTHFKNIFQARVGIEADLAALNRKVLSVGMDDIDFKIEQDLLGNYQEVLKKEEIFFKKKSRENWLKDGDRNTTTFNLFIFIGSKSILLSSFEMVCGITPKILSCALLLST